MSAQSLCIQIQQTRMETVLHYTCRDRNVLSIQSDLLGASSIGLKNILCLTGDPPKLGNYPGRDGGVRCRRYWAGQYRAAIEPWTRFGGQSCRRIHRPDHRCRGQPRLAGYRHGVRRFAYKVEAGAEYAITQPVFDLNLLEAFLKRIEEFRIPVIAGIWPLTSLRNAEFMKNDLRVSMPDEIMARMQKADTPDRARAEGIHIAREMLAAARPMVQGVQVSAPLGRLACAVEILEGVLSDTEA